MNFFNKTSKKKTLAGIIHGEAAAAGGEYQAGPQAAQPQQRDASGKIPVLSVLISTLLWKKLLLSILVCYLVQGYIYRKIPSIIENPSQTLHELNFLFGTSWPLNYGFYFRCKVWCAQRQNMK